MNGVGKAMIDCIGYEICGRGGKIALPEVSAPFLSELYRLSKAHDMAHLVGDALTKCGILTERETGNKFDRQFLAAVYRAETLDAETDRIRKLFVGANIDFIPLKGAVIRRLYPEPWMRTSCDIDILVKEESLVVAVAVLLQNGYREGTKGSHDIGMYSENGVHLELHYLLTEKDGPGQAELVLGNIWNICERIGDTCESEMNDETFYLYFIAHTAKHVVHGGCGVKPFADLWILRAKLPQNEEKRNELLEICGLKKFADAARSLTEVWFGGKERTETDLEFENFVLSGGVYGTLENSVFIGRNEKGGKIRYLLSRLWLKKDTLKYRYPVLEKHGWLLPVCEIRRWLTLLFGGGMKRGAREIRLAVSNDPEKTNRAARLMKDIGLSGREPQ